MRIMSLGHAYTHLNFKAKLAYKKEKSKTNQETAHGKRAHPGRCKSRGGNWGVCSAGSHETEGRACVKFGWFCFVFLLLVDDQK